MSSEQNKTLARRFQEAFNERNWEGCRSLLAPDCRSYQPGAPGALNNDQFEGVGQMFAAAFPDLNVTIHEQVAEGDTVVTRMSFVGTHEHDFQGIPPTGNTMNLEGYILDRWKRGASSGSQNPHTGRSALHPRRSSAPEWCDYRQDRKCALRRHPLRSGPRSAR